MSDKEIEVCQEAIVVIGEASESDVDSDGYQSDCSSLESNSVSNESNQNLNKLVSNINLNSQTNKDQSLNKPLVLAEDHFKTNENNLINERLIKDNRFLRNSIVSFGTQRYQQTINDLNQLNQSLIKNQEKIQNANQHLEKTKSNLNNLSDNLNEIFSSFDFNCRLKI